MSFIFQVIKEHIQNIHLIFRMATYENKSKYQMHYLGLIWQILNPIMQVGVLWVVFDLGIRGGTPVGETPFIIWLVIGMIPWFFITPSIIQGSNSVYAKVNMVAKMKFPVSVLPTITIIANSFGFFIMLLLLGVLLFLNRNNPGIFLLQLPYYLFCTYAFLFSFCLLSSTVSALIRDYQLFLQSLMRMLFFLTPIFWVPTSMPEQLQSILKLNPFYYLIEGYRSTFLGQGWFFEDALYMVYFWFLTMLFLFVGAFMQNKYKKSFVDYL